MKELKAKEYKHVVVFYLFYCGGKERVKVKELKTKEYMDVVVFYLFYCGKARPGPVTIWSEYGWMGASAAILFSRKDFRKIIKKIFLN